MDAIGIQVLRQLPGEYGRSVTRTTITGDFYGNTYPFHRRERDERQLTDGAALRRLLRSTR
jgi:hypothetical protein